MMGPAIFFPRNVDEAVELLADYDGAAKVVAGSTALTLLMNQGLVAPQALVSLARVPDLDQLSVVDQKLRVGALVTHARAARDPLTRRAAPVLAESLALVGNAQVRAAATVGGVLAEADYASDPPAAVLLLDGQVVAHGPAGRRELSCEELLVGFYETSLAADEIITEVVMPEVPQDVGTAYLKYSSRSAEDRPCVGVAAWVRLDGDGGCAELRVAVGAAAERPLRLRDVESQATGKALNPEAVAEAYAAAVEPVADVRGSAWYRTEMTRVWVARAIAEAARRAQHASSHRVATGVAS